MLNTTSTPTSSNQTENSGLAGNVKSRSTKTEVPLAERAALTPSEFAGFFGRSQTWGYRRIYAGDVKVIQPGGRILIPQGEVQRLLKDAAIYNGRQE